MNLVISKKTTALLFSTLMLVNFLAVNTIDTSSANSYNSINIILMIGDGMGYEHVKLARWVELGKNDSFDMENLNLTLNVTTFSADSAITDSAASATAMASGQKTNNGMLGQNPSGIDLVSITDIAMGLSKSTGLISTKTTTDATPAAFYAHTESRYNYDTIEAQIIDSNIDILLGGGANYYSSAQLAAIESNGYALVYNRSQMLSESSNKIFGLFGNNYMEVERLRDYTLTPSLAEMTTKAINILASDPDGFFLMVEGAQIDLEAHDNDPIDVALETIAFIEAVDVVLDYASTHSNTIVIITADHETGGLTVTGDTLNNTLPSERATEAEKRALRIARANNITTTWSSTDHTAANVPLYGHGTYLTALNNNTIIDNTEIFQIMDDYINELPLIIPEFSNYIALALIPLFSFITLLFYKKKKK